MARNNQQPRNREHPQVHAVVGGNNRGVARNNQQPRNREDPQVHAVVGENNRGMARNNQQLTNREHPQVYADVRGNNRGVVRNNQQPRNREHPQVHADVGQNNRGVARHPRGAEANFRRDNGRHEVNNRQTGNIEINVPQDSIHNDDLINCERCSCRCVMFWIILVINLFVVLSICVVVIVAMVIVFYSILIVVFSLAFMCHIIFHIISNMCGRCGSCNCDGLKNGLKNCKSTFFNYHKKILKSSKFCGKKLQQFFNYLWWLFYVGEYEDENQNQNGCCAEILCPKIACAVSSLVCFMGVTCASVLLLVIFFPVRLFVMVVFCLCRMCCKCED